MTSRICVRQSNVHHKSKFNFFPQIISAYRQSLRAYEILRHLEIRVSRYRRVRYAVGGGRYRTSDVWCWCYATRLSVLGPNCWTEAVIFISIRYIM